MKKIGKLSALVTLVMLLGFLLPAAFTAQPARAEDWTQVNQKGFDGNQNSQVYAMCYFDGDLFAGTQYSGAGGEVWRYDGISWSRAGSGGLGNPLNTAIYRLCVFGGDLYAGTNNNTSGCEVLRYNGGTSWTRVNASGFGSAFNVSASAMTVYGSTLVVGTSNTNNGTQVWQTSGVGGPPYTDWTQINTSGYDDWHNASTLTILSQGGGTLWAGTFNLDEGCEIWYYLGGGTWTSMISNGFGEGANVEGIYDLEAKDLNLYASTGSPWASRRCEVWCLDGTTWRKAAADGFGDSHNTMAPAMLTDGGYLYVGTGNLTTGAEVWRTAASGTAPFMDWTQVNRDHFNDPANDIIYSMAMFDTSMMAGTQNFDGCAVFKGSRGAGPTWYLAEGSTAWGFSTYISIENPNSSAVTCDVTYMPSDGVNEVLSLALPAMSRTTVQPFETVGAKDFSTIVQCRENKGIAVDRTMYWTGPTSTSPEFHSSVGVIAPDRTWYLPEGSSQWGFETWLLIQNPNSVDATCRVTYMIEGEGPRVFNKTVPANTRRTYNMSDDIGARDASISVSSEVPIIPERAMYRNNRREGHDSIGTVSPAMDYYLAEGTTAWGFTTFVLVQNPNPQACDVHVTYMTASGAQPQPAFTMPAQSRYTIRVNDDLPDQDFSTLVEGSRPIIAERAMYWDKGTGEACHDSIGMANPHKTFYLPDGQVGDNIETWTLVQNPNGVPVQVRVSYLLSGGGTPATLEATVPANSRITFNMADLIPLGQAAIKVECLTGGRKIMVERAMYWNSRGAGTDTIGGYSD